MKRWTLETFEALELRVMRHVQRAHPGDQHAGANVHSVAGCGVPDSFGFIPNRFLKASIEAEVRREPVMLDTSLEVVVDFLLARIHAGPFRGRSEGERVKVGRNIAGAAGVTIFPPGAADVRTLFDDEKRLHAGFKKLDAHTKTGKTGADNKDINIGNGGVCGWSGRLGHARVAISLPDSAAATWARRNAALSRSDWRASGTRWGTSCQAWGTTGQIFRSTETPAARARSARRVESSRRTSSAPTWMRSGGRPRRSAYRGEASGLRGSVS